MIQEQAQRAFQIGLQHSRAGNVEAAKAYYVSALRLDPKHPGAHCNLGAILTEQRNWDAALAHSRTATELSPGDAEMLSNLGNLLWRMQRYEEARSALMASYRLKPNAWTVHHNLGLLHYGMGHNEEAERCYRRALELNPGNADVLSDLSYPILASGDLRRGLEAHEARWAKLYKHTVWQTTIPRWRGEDLAGKTLFVHWEQGFGDTLQFCRFVEMVQQRGCARVIFSVQNALKVLMSHTLPWCIVVGQDEVPEGIDYFSPLMSLPLYLKINYGNVTGFPLVVYPHLASQIIRPSERLKIGICWAGNAGFESDFHRSMPLQALLGIAGSGVDLYSLQVGQRSADVQTCGADGLITDITLAMTDFAASGAIMKQLDLVVAVDTAVLHLAAGVCVPTIALLPHLRCWRWLRNRDDSPWYPGTLRILQQKTPGDWREVVARLKKLLNVPLKRLMAA